MIARNQNVDVTKVPKALKYVLVTRTVTSCLSLLGIMVGIRTLPLTIFMLIINTNSFTTGLLQWLHLKKPVKAYEIAAMVGCYLGIVLIVYGSEE
jgi:drug/metabolite transporter (DMT)-like permease